MNTQLNALPSRDACLRRVAKIAIDLTACSLAVAGSYFLRFHIPEILEHMRNDAHFLMLIVGFQIIGFAVFRLYSALWRYTGYHSLTKLVIVNTVALGFSVVVAHALDIPSLPRSIIALNWFLANFLCAGVRVFQRMLHTMRSRRPRSREADQNILIYGAGNAGENLLRSIEVAADIHIRVVGFVDDNPLKLGQSMRNRRVLGDRSQIGELVREHRISDIYLAIPTLTGKEFRDLLDDIRRQTGDRVRIHTLPGILHLANGRVSIDQIRQVEIADLLRRNPVRLDREPVNRLIGGQTVMVVGGGGSIGLELCKQIARLNPASLIVVDSCEFNTYKAEAELKRECPQLSITCLVADAGSMPLMHRVFAQYRPAYVFHAAAYKHVPLMEAHPWAAVLNNLSCTLTLTELSGLFGVKRFVLISSDKAVRPSSVMGATKRICEIITLTQNRYVQTEFLAVRFGNVLGSSGSVIPLFTAQIAAGGPVTVTHPEMSRYFMLIPEAVELVLQAAAMGERGNIYVLDMGEPVKIADLARHMIQLSGGDPDNEVKIIYTGLRPGEKLHESLYFEGDEAATQIPNLFELKPRLTTTAAYLAKSKQLVNNACSLEYGQLLTAIRDLAPEYRPAALEKQLAATLRPLRPAAEAPVDQVPVENG